MRLLRQARNDMCVSSRRQARNDLHVRLQQRTHNSKKGKGLGSFLEYGGRNWGLSPIFQFFLTQGLG